MQNGKNGKDGNGHALGTLTAKQEELYLENLRMERDTSYDDLHQEDSYINQFIEDQNNQYTPWNYATANRSHPMQEAKGNAKLYAILWIVFGSIYLFFAVLFLLGFDSADRIIGFFLFSSVWVICLLVAKHYFKVHKNRITSARKKSLRTSLKYRNRHRRRKNKH
jgi:hypothetical protein